MKDKNEIIKFFLSKNILVNKQIIEKLSENDVDLQNFYLTIEGKIDLTSLVVIDQYIDLFLKSSQTDTNWKEYDKSVVLAEKGDSTANQKFKEFIGSSQELKKEESKKDSNVKVIFSYDKPSKKRDVQDFVAYFNQRYNQIEKLLKNRSELQNLLSIKRIKQKKEKDNISTIGIVKEITETKNGNKIITLEDKTDTINVLVNKNKPEIFEAAKDIVPDEVIGVTGVNGQNIIFSNTLVWPEVPTNKEVKKSKDEAYAVFLSDLHFGSDHFLGDNLKKFVSWINGHVGSDDQKNIASKIRYIFIAGDIVDGCGIYPGQEDELTIQDIYAQYQACAEFLKQIPRHIHLIIGPGNHDAMRMAEPQPALYKDFAKPLWEIPNIIMVSNPAIINIHSSDDFSGFDVLMYHGYSFDHYVANVDGIRRNGGYDRADLIMKFLLKRRHLAPTHTSTLYIPDISCDHLVIEQIPDFFVTGHIHKCSVSNYRNITLICGSCWQSKTPFQEKVGHHPEPCRVPIVNLQTRDVRIMRF